MEVLESRADGCRWRLVVAVIPVLLGLPSCARQEAGVALHPVQGRIVFEGRPTPHALVIFHPLDPAPEVAGLRPHGEVGPDGTFSLGTRDVADGAPAGDYRVTVEWWLTPSRPGAREGDDGPPVNRLPARYANPAASGLRVRIAEGPNQLAPIQLSR